MKKLGYILFPLCTLGVGALAGYLSEPGLTQVYPLLEKSPLTPPGYVFPLVWAVLYLLMGLGLARVVQRGGPGSGLAAFFWVLQLALNFSWSLLFFGDGERRHVPVGTSREAQHHRIVSFVDAARRYVEHFRRFDRNVVFRIRGGLSVFVAVYAV